jgi:hypothetical protein
MAISYPLIFPPQGVRSIRMIPDDMNAIQASPFTGQQQVQSHQGQIWRAEVAFPPMKQDGYADDIAAFLAATRGIYGTFLLGDSSRKTPRGPAVPATGTFPAISGGGQSGSTILTEGWQDGYVLSAGDYIQLGGGNILLRSEEFNSSPWTTDGTATVTANSTTGPDGASTADLITSGSGSGYIYQVSAPTNAGNLCFSVWLKAPSGTRTINIGIIDASGTSTVTANVTTTWQKFYVSHTRITQSSVILSIDGLAASQTLYLSRAGLNYGNSPSPYVATTSASVFQTARLHKVLFSAATNGAGVSSLEIWPRLRETPADGAEIITYNAQGTFRLASNERGWDVDSGKIYTAGISAVEAI